jgi:ribosomal protein L29
VLFILIRDINSLHLEWIFDPELLSELLELLSKLLELLSELLELLSELRELLSELLELLSELLEYDFFTRSDRLPNPSVIKQNSIGVN